MRVTNHYSSRHFISWWQMLEWNYTTYLLESFNRCMLINLNNADSEEDGINVTECSVKETINKKNIGSEQRFLIFLTSDVWLCWNKHVWEPRLTSAVSPNLEAHLSFSAATTWMCAYFTITEKQIKYCYWVMIHSLCNTKKKKLN